MFGNLQGVRFVCIVNHADTLEFIQHCLEMYGAGVRTARTAADGLHRLAEFAPHIVISDICLPDDDGPDFHSIEVHVLDAKAAQEVLDRVETAARDLDAVLDDIAMLPPDGKPGSKAGCDTTDKNEPFGDAYDCLTKDQQTAVTTLLQIWAKAIAAYEYELVSGPSDFDKFVAAGPTSDAIP